MDRGIPQTGKLQSVGSQKVGQDQETNIFTFAFINGSRNESEFSSLVLKKK